MKRILAALGLISLALASGGCANTLVHSPLSATPKGVPWTETRTYDVYVYVGGDVQYTKGLNGLAEKSEEPKLVYFGTHELLDKVNDVTLDASRPKWQVNYSAMPFSDGGLELALDDAGTGTVKRVKATGKPGTAAALNAANTAVKTKDDIAAEKVSDVKRELELVKAKTDLIDQQKKYQTALNPDGGGS